MNLTVEALLSGFLGSVIGAVIGGLLSMVGSVRAIRAAQADLEKDERRRLKLNCIVALAGVRHILAAPQSASAQDTSQLQFELNRAVVLWGDDKAVLDRLREVRGGASAAIVGLIREMAKSTTLGLSHVSDDDLETIFRLNRALSSGQPE